MKPLLIFGASRGTGSYLLRYALERQIPCTALVRSQETANILQDQGVNVVVGDACCADDITKSMQLAGENAIIVSTLGGARANYEAQRQIIDCAEAQGLKQMLLVTSIGCGNSWATLSDRAKKAFGLAVREKTLSEQWLQSSSLSYCILRPGGLLDGEPKLTVQSYPMDQEIHGMVDRASLALLILDQLKEPLKNTIYSVIDPSIEMQR